MAANKGEWYRYPTTSRLVKGPLDQQGGPQAYAGGGQGYDSGQGSGGQGY